MSWFYNLKIKSKILLGFVVGAMFSAIIGYISIINIRALDVNDTELFEHMTEPLGWIGQISTDFQQVRILTRDILLAKNQSEKDSYAASLKTLRDTITALTKQYESRIEDDQIRMAYNEFIQSRKEYGKGLDKIVKLAKEDKIDEGFEFLKTGLRESAKAEMDAIDKLVRLTEDDAKSKNQENTAIANKTVSFTLTILIISFIIALGLGIWIARVISNPINKLTNIADKVSKGDIDIEIDQKSEDETGLLMAAFKNMIQNIKQQVITADKISNGDLNVEVKILSDKDVLNKSFQKVIETLKNLVAEAGTLSKAAVDGKLSVRGNEDKFSGGYKDIVKGVNNTLDAVIGPLNVAAEYVDRISKGDIPARIKDNYNGDFNEIKNNLNTCIDAVIALIADTNMLSEAAVAGKLSTRADAARHQGDFRKIVEGVNNTLDAVIGPLNVAAEYVDRISKGDIPNKIAENYNGDFNEIKINLNTCIDAVNGLINDVNMLSEAAVRGDFEVRADNKKHFGDFARIISGINQTLDTVVDKVFWYEGLLDAIPMPVSVTDMDMKWTFINKPVENMLNTKRKDILGKNCSQWNSAICKTEDCGIAGLKKNKLQTVFAQMGMNFQVDTSYILNRKGEKIGHIELVQDVTSRVKVSEFSSKEVERLAGNMKLLAAGNMDLDYNVAEGNEYTKAERENFLKIHESTKVVIKTIQVIFNGVARIKNNIENGNLQDRGNAELFAGEWKSLVQAINGMINALVSPIYFMAENINMVSKGDIPNEITEAYKGEFNQVKENLNTCFRSIKSLVEDSIMLSTAAIEGRLSTRAEASKHQGDFRRIIEGVNQTLDSVIIPVNEGVAALEKMGTGDLTVKIASDYKGDHQLIKNSINAVSDALSSALREVSEAIEATASASNQISSSTEEMAAGAMEQTHQTTEVAGGVEEMSKTIYENTKNAAYATDAAKDAGQKAKDGGSVVKDTIEGMNKIADVVKKSAVTVLELGKSSDQIGEIVQVIDDIADQTNLLALNAAIEAARAGEQGRGFAVVADEVRKLAERTTKATKEIAAMIKQIQKDTHEAVSSMEQGTIEVEKGKSLANKAGVALNDILDGSQKVVDIVAQVAAASEQQSSAAEQISRNLESISSVSQQSAAGTQQIARAAEDLNRLTLNLESLINHFKIEQTSAEMYDRNKLNSSRTQKLIERIS